MRHGRKDQALRSIERLGSKDKQNSSGKLAMIERTVEIEEKLGGTPSLLDLFKGTDLRRTIIICLIYASQNFAGNLIANQATFFFERKLYQGDPQIQLAFMKLTPRQRPASRPISPSNSTSSIHASNSSPTPSPGC